MTNQTLSLHYNFSRSIEKAKVITRMEEIIGNELSAYNNMPEYVLLKEQLISIIEQEKKVA